MKKMGMLAKQNNNELELKLFDSIFNYEINNYQSVFLFSSLDYEIETIFKALRLELRDKKKMLFIASKPDDYEENDNNLTELKNYFQKFDIKEFTMLDHRTSKFASIKHVESADIIFLMWGNPITQLAFLQEYEIDQIIKDFKGVIIGVSAGTINLSKKAYCSKDEDFPETQIYNGLGIVDITIDPHFDNQNKEQVTEFLKSPLEIIGLPDQSFIKIDKYGMKTIIGPYYIKENEKLKSLTDD